MQFFSNIIKLENLVSEDPNEEQKSFCVNDIIEGSSDLSSPTVSISSIEKFKSMNNLKVITKDIDNQLSSGEIPPIANENSLIKPIFLEKLSPTSISKISGSPA